MSASLPINCKRNQYRELFEEVGLSRKDVRILASTRNWLRYKLPKRLAAGLHIDVRVVTDQLQKKPLLFLADTNRLCVPTHLNLMAGAG
jgi:8-oxo-dGTP pyrophosphatase MutT (NUDIX family)